MNTLRKKYSDQRRGWQACLLLCLMLAMGGCSDSGGGEAAPDVDPGPPPANGNPPAPPPIQQPLPPNLYTEATEATATITGVTIASPPVVTFQVVDGNGVALTGLTASNVRFHIAKLVPGSNGDSSHWQSYINRLEEPNVNPGNGAMIQATSESGSSGTLVDNGDGTYTYTFATDITNVTSPLAVTYEPTLTHRVAMQFGGGVPTNPTYDFVPATGATTGIDTREVVSIDTCNTCHNQLALHGGGRIDTKLCVVCHNPGTREPNANVSLDFKVYIHKIHMGRNLPSVIAGGSYVIYGYRDSLHDYTEVGFPQDINNCGKCHAGTETVTQNPPIITSAVTSEGDNWQEVPTMEACGACHDDVDFSTHNGGQTDNSNCRSCHNVSGIAGSIATAHENLKLEGTRTIAVKINSITNTAPGQFPAVNFSVTDPSNADAPYDILTDPIWTAGRLRLRVAWSTTDYTNVGSGGPTPGYTDALVKAVDNGDGTFNLTSDFAIAAAATGSGFAILEGRAVTPATRIPFLVDPKYFSIDETGGVAVPRRQVVSVENCNTCHAYKSEHGDSRTNTEAQCQTCHNPRLATTDNYEALDFKRMIHEIHAAGIRETPLVVGSHTFDEAEVHFPGHINDCNACHVNDSYELPLGTSVLASTYNMGVDPASYADDLMISPTASVCSGCHDSSVAKIHMEQNGADFAATESTINMEACAICHGPGRVADLAVVHELD